MSRLLLIVSMFCLAIVTGASAAAAGPRERCFGETGQCLHDPLLAYWERNGGLAVFGYPITAQRFETVEGRTLEVQWFERDRLEIQADGAVTAGRLGARTLELQGRPWQSFPAETPSPSPECRYFPVTQHNSCGAFLDYWERNGGLARFGYPLTGVIEEELEGRTYQVQYYERRRMEYLPEYQGTPYAVLLGLLGRNLAQVDGCVALVEPFEAFAYAHRDLLGCPGYASRELVGNKRLGVFTVPAATQPFEHGMLLWYNPIGGNSPGSILVITFDPAQGRLVWQQYQDTWREGLPTGIPEEPPPGLFEPVRGFGYLWANNSDVRARLGWATAPEQGTGARYRAFAQGFFLYLEDRGQYYIFTKDGGVYGPW